MTLDLSVCQTHPYSFSDYNRDAYESTDIAWHILMWGREHQQPMTAVRLILLTYIAHGVCLALEGVPLVKIPAISAMAIPAFEPVFLMFRHWGSVPINVDGVEWESNITKYHKRICDAVANVYTLIPTVGLGDITTAPGTPYAQTRKKAMRQTRIIPNDLIRKYYEKELKTGHLSADSLVDLPTTASH